MKEPALLAELHARDIHVWADGDKLQCDAPTGVLTPELRDRLQQCKSEVLEFLRGPAEMSFSQQRLWFMDQLEPGGAAYVMPKAFEMRGALDVPVLERALATLVGRHETLRTVFMNVGERWLQVVSELGAWQLPVLDLGSEAHPRQRLAQLLLDEATRGFDLAQGPLFRARLYRLAADTHVLLLTMHHIVSDGWSLGVLIRELSEVYGRLSRGETPTLPALPFQYRDFARWQRNRLQGEVLEGLLAHWRSRLVGAPQVLELPSDRPRPAVETFRGAVYSFTLPLKLADGLRGLARREGATLFMTLLAGFALLLSRYSGQQDFLVGTPVANRNRAEIEDLVGIFINTLVLRADLSGELSVRQYLGRMREACLDAYAHQDLPFEQLVEELRPQRDMSRNPLFQVMFALQNTPQGALNLPGLMVTPVEVGRTVAQFDLTLTMQETPEGLKGIFEYATDLFDESTIVRMAAHLHCVLEGMITSTERRVEDLPLLTESERNKMLVEWNDTATDYPTDVLLHQLFEAQVARTPDAVAAVFEGQRLTYRELDAKANQLAHQLQKRGVGPDTLVAICVERSLEMIIGLLGILKAGGGYVPIDPNLPMQRIAFILEDVRPPVVLTQQRFHAQLPFDRAHAICVDTEWPAIAQESVSPPANSTIASNIAYVIYTSGSTGQPKGVVIPHVAICHHMFWIQRVYPLSDSDVILQSTSYSFDASLWEIFGPLLAGARLIVPPPGDSVASAELARMILEHGVSTQQVVPSQLRVLLEEPAYWRCAPPLKDVYCAGEALTKDLCDIFYGRLPQAILHNMYGPTETTIESTVWDVPPDRRPEVIPIGRPIDNTRTYIVNPQMQLSPIGVPGELLIGGIQLARGYLNRDELTAEKFIPDPFLPGPGARVYKTGDLVRYLPDGNIDWLGRIDHQVKIRGYRIELGEIEAVLAEHPEVRQAVVYLWTSKPDDGRLVACCVPAKAGMLAPISLRKHLRARLPDYMVPQYFLPVEEIPLTPNGKVDRHRLPTPVVVESGIGQHEAPADSVEAKIAEIWTSLIGPSRSIGRADKFFEMGGHSLLALRALRQMEQKLGVKLDLRMLFQDSVAEIATRCR